MQTLVNNKAVQQAFEPKGLFAEFWQKKAIYGVC